MKNLFISVLAIALTTISCTKEETQENTSSSNYKTTTNRYKFSYDLTDDGIVNFVDEPKENNGVYIFEYKGNEKKLTISTVSQTVISVSRVFTVDSEEKGIVQCHDKDFYCVFEFIGTAQVNQIFKVSNRQKKIIYLYR
jgi:hypothetical protein